MMVGQHIAKLALTAPGISIPDRRHVQMSWQRRTIEIALLALVYWAVARLSLNLALVRGQVTPVWPPTGIAVAALLLVGRRTWPAITLGALAVNLPIGPSPLTVAGIAVGNTLAPLVSTELLRLARFHLDLDRLRDALALVFLGGLAGMLVSATGGTSMLLLGGAILPAQFWSTWAVWWTGDAMGVLLVAPFLFSFAPSAMPALLPWRRRIELTVLLLVTSIVAYTVFQSRLGMEYLVFPFVIVAAWRFRLQGACPTALIAAGIAIWAAINGSGPFAGGTLLEKMITLQVFNVTIAFSSFVLSSFVEARERRDEMARLYNAAQISSEAKSSFLNMAAHELRTPLSVIMGYLSLLSDGTLGEVPVPWGQPLEILESKARELNKIIDDLLAASRIDAGTLPHHQSELDLRDLIQAAVVRAQPRADLLGAQIVTDPDDGPLPMKGDPSQLNRILDNLINNSLTYSFRPPRVAVRADRLGSRARVRVEDNGIGIPNEARERVFDRFFRLNDPAFEGLPGTGLGLYLSRNMAEAHGGSLVIERSEIGAGTVFALDLPT